MIDFMFGMHEELSLSVCLLKILCMQGMFRVEAFLDNVQKRCLKVSFTAVTTNTRRRRVFFFHAL